MYGRYILEWVTPGLEYNLKVVWNAIDRISPPLEATASPVLSQAVREKIRSFISRYETQRAALLPALHVVQNALGHISPQAMKEIAGLLEIAPSKVLDLIGFYTHLSDQPKGRKTIVVCRSISCRLMGGQTILETIKQELGIDEHQTTPDGRYTLMTEECLAACEHGPCMLIDERMHKLVQPEDVRRILNDPNNDKPQVPVSGLYMVTD